MCMREIRDGTCASMNIALHGVLQLQDSHTHKSMCMRYSNTMSSWIGAKSAHGLIDISTFGPNGGMCTSSWSPKVCVNVCVHSDCRLIITTYPAVSIGLPKETTTLHPAHFTCQTESRNNQAHKHIYIRVCWWCL